MGKWKKASSAAFILLVYLLMVYPVVGGRLDERFGLSGVTEEAALEDLSFGSLWDGSFQESLNTWLENHFSGRNLLIKLRGQMMYSLFHESPNTNVTVGRQNYIFSNEYIWSHLSLSEPEEDAYFEALEQKLNTLNGLLEENDKELYIFITPSKAHVCSAYIPWRFKVLRQDVRNNYEGLAEMLRGSDLHYFDSNVYIEENRGSLQAPVFYKTGTHWSHPWGQSAAAAFARYISETSSRWELSTLDVTEYESGGPVWPDADVFSSMNLMEQAKGRFYMPRMEIIEQKDTPNVFMRGGSFMGQSLAALVNAGMFGRDTHLENSLYYVDRYSECTTLSSFTAYDEVPLDRLVGQADLVILEVNEASADSMSFGLIDYLLGHPDYLDRNY